MTNDAGKIKMTGGRSKAMTEDQAAAANEARLTALDLGLQALELAAWNKSDIDPSPVLRSMRKAALELIQHIDCALGEGQEQT